AAESAAGATARTRGAATEGQGEGPEGREAGERLTRTVQHPCVRRVRMGVTRPERMRLASARLPRTHRKRLRNDLAVVHRKRVGAERNIVPCAPGDIGEPAVHSQAPQCEPLERPRGKGADELDEKVTNLSLSLVDSRFTV